MGRGRVAMDDVVDVEERRIGRGVEACGAAGRDGQQPCRTGGVVGLENRDPRRETLHQRSGSGRCRVVDEVELGEQHQVGGFDLTSVGPADDRVVGEGCGRVDVDEHDDAVEAEARGCWPRRPPGVGRPRR